ncbi:MAG TPA: tetratricopeptide repeat protein [Anaerolineae bacterium]|nr:tetratricopeptide repeat protein [Anaerolineae bacterium]HIQ05411.1 tetratricopeptide repeat protein [Anaerolineae bacterium]
MDDAVMIARIQDSLGMAHLLQGDWEAADEALAAARNVLLPAGFRLSLADLNNHLGKLYRLRGKWQESLVYHQQALELAQAMQSLPNIALAQREMGCTLTLMDHLAEAEEWLREAEALFHRLAMPLELIRTQLAWGNLRRRQKDIPGAQAAYTASLETAVSLGMRPEQAAALQGLGEVRLDANDADAALPLLEEALALRQQLGNPQDMLESLLILARARWLGGGAVAAEETLSRATRLTQRLNRTDVQVRLVWLRAEQAIAASQVDKAAALYHHALHLSEKQDTDCLRTLRQATQQRLQQLDVLSTGQPARRLDRTPSRQ